MISEDKNNDNNKSIFLSNISRGIAKGFIELSNDNTRITYLCKRRYSTSFKNPEEKVRGSFFVELVLDYQYPKEKIDFEVIIPKRTPGDFADIVIYEDDELKNPYIVVECKRDGISDSEFKQAIEQLFGNSNSIRSKYAILIAGITKRAYDIEGFQPSERERNVIADIPVKYGKAPIYRYIKGDKLRDIKIISRDELIRTLGKAHDTVWQGGKRSPTTAFDEIAKLLFCKLKDEKNTLKGKEYKFQIGTHETTEEVFKRINSIYQKAKQEDAEVFKEDIRLDDKIIYNVVEHLQGINFSKTDLDTKGVAFEKFMTDFFKGKMGQFFTPREIVQFCVKILDPQREHIILDPACGSGGFLLNTMDHIRIFAENNYDEKDAWTHWHNFAMKNLYGIEINDQIARVCKMNMIIHDDGHTNIINTDALSDFKEILEVKKDFKPNFFDMILTNPPFGAVAKRSEKDYLDLYDLGKNRNSQKLEILFIERVINFVKPGTGKIAIILPDSVLSNSSLQYVRNFILKKAKVLAIVSLPQFTFSHYGAGVKASLVFLQRKSFDNEELGDYPIFMAIAEHIGYDATGRPDHLNDLDPIADEYLKFLEEPDLYEGY